MKLSVHDLAGKEVESIEVDDAVFGITPNEPVVHQALVATLANRRAGTASTKTRGEVHGSTHKIRKQKGGGTSRQGSIKAPQHRHGGIVHGPRPHQFDKDMPKKMRRLAIRSVLSAKVADGSLRVVKELSVAQPSTKELAGVIKALGFQRSVLVVTATQDQNVKASLKNLDKVSLAPAAYLSVGNMLGSQGLLMTVDAVRGAEALWGGEKAATKRPKAPSLAGGVTNA